MKTLKFQPHFVQPILSGEKTSTWRMFDDKNIHIGDEIGLINKDTGEEFGKATIISIEEKPLGDLKDADFEGHNKYKNQEDMLNHYRDYYGESVTLSTPIKLINFKLA